MMNQVTGDSGSSCVVHHQHHLPLCELRIADSTFLGYVTSHPTFEAIQHFRRNLIDRGHPKACHVPYAAATALVGEDTPAPAPAAAAGIQRLESCCCDDDNEPPASQIGATLLNELKHYRQRLTRQTTVRISGNSSRRRRLSNNNNIIINGGCVGEKSISFRRKSWVEELVENYDVEEEEEEEEEGDDDSVAAVATAIIVVRYFDHRLLGVTCTRLTSVYARTARLALHRHLHGDNVPFVERFSFDTILHHDDNHKNLYALGAGDTELILNVVGHPSAEEEEEDESSTNSSSTDDTSKSSRSTPRGRGRGGDGGISSRSDIVQKLMSELKFEHMVGSKNERLPRLQNLQADFLSIGDGTDTSSSGRNVIMPVYRYPGNYSGTEWPTHPWSKTTLSIKRAVEEALRPLYVQHMNHCVTNLYRNGYDRIDHHSDKDLDLNRSGVIVSVSLGSTRVMEIRDKMYPHDVARVELPPYSMFVLGPNTNARFTHAVLPSEREISFDFEEGDMGNRGEPSTTCNDDDDDVTCNIERGGRISLTFREVRTFLDIKTQRLFGQGVKCTSPIVVGNDGTLCEDSLSEAVEYARQQEWKERRSALAIAVGIGAAAGYVSSSRSKEGVAAVSDNFSLLRSVSTMVISTSAFYWYIQHARNTMCRLREEKEARALFSKASATGNKY